MTKAIVLGGSRGIGKAISDALKTIEIDVFAASKKDIDTSDLKSIKKFLEKKYPDRYSCFKHRRSFFKTILNHHRRRLESISQSIISRVCHRTTKYQNQ